MIFVKNAKTESSLTTISYKHKKGVIVRDFLQNKYLYLMLVPVLLYYLIFWYGPMYGSLIAFKDFSPAKGFLGSPWVGFKHFVSFFKSYYFKRIVTNTVLLSLNLIIFEFPAPIILALLLNEVRNKLFKKMVQTITYVPHFVSIMVVSGIIIDFTSTYGVINDIIEWFGGERVNLLIKPELFRPIYVISNIWQGVGWGSIIYLAALAGIDVEQYEAAVIDGAGRWKQMIHVTLPGIAPTIVIMFILRLGALMNIGYEKIILLYNPLTYETADVISSFVYRKGLQDFSYSYSAAVGLFNSVINFFMLIAANKLSKKVNETSLW